MQLLDKMKRKNSSEKTDQPLKPINPPAPTDHKPHSSKRAHGGFKIFIRSMSGSSNSPSPSPSSTSPSSPAHPTTSLPPHVPDAHPTPAPAPAVAPRRQLVRVPSVLYCPVLEKDGKGYGNEHNRRTTEL